MNEIKKDKSKSIGDIVGIYNNNKIEFNVV